MKVQQRNIFAVSVERPMNQQGKGIAAVPARKELRFACAAGALILGVGLLAGCGRKNASAAVATPAMAVTVVKVHSTDVPLTSEWVGTLDGYVNAQIQPQASGYLIEQNYKEGAQVSKGQVLFEIDPRPFQAALDQAKGQLAQAKGQVQQAQAQLGLAEINVNRNTPLAQERAIAQSQLDNDTQQKAQSEALVRSAQASVAAAEAAVANAELNLGFTQVRSLISGVAGQATTQVGNLVNTTSVLTSVSQLNPIKAYFSISDSEYLVLTQRARQGGGDLLKNASAIPLTLTLSNGEDFPQKGRIEFVDRQMNNQTGAIRIAAAFPNPGNVLRPGQFGRVKAETELRRGAVLIPQVAVQEFQGLHQVYVAGADGKAHLETVTLGPQVGTDWLVEAGVSPGALIIVDNLQKLHEGAVVTAHQGPAAAGAGAASNTTGGN
jgi:membrane fusion protein, multidrug efflux system